MCGIDGDRDSRTDEVGRRPAGVGVMARTSRWVTTNERRRAVEEGDAQ